VLYFLDKELERQPGAFDPEHPPERMLLADHAGALHAFERRDGRYVAQPRVRGALRVEVDPSRTPFPEGRPTYLKVGVVWEGLEVHFNQALPVPAPGAPVEWTLDRPADATELWWGPRDGERHRVPLASDTTSLVLR
jgi:hypothetical protein